MQTYTKKYIYNQFIHLHKTILTNPEIVSWFLLQNISFYKKVKKKKKILNNILFQLVAKATF